MYWVPPDAIRFGLANDPVGTHGSRTIMLSELTALLAACSATAAPEDYRAAIIEENALGKKTTATRKESARRLRELYALDLDRPVFRAMRDLWDADEAARPLLALLCAVARDPILRATGDVIIGAATAALIIPQQLEAATESAFPARYNPMMLANIGRHAASSWQQSGHLEGRRPTPIAGDLSAGLGRLRDRARPPVRRPGRWAVHHGMVPAARRSAARPARAGAGGGPDGLDRVPERGRGDRGQPSAPAARRGGGRVSALDDLLTNYRERVGRPWQDALSGPQRVWFVIYEPAQERRLRLRLYDFEVATVQAGHGWVHMDLTNAFPEWLGAHDYREEYFAEPELMTYALADFAKEFTATVRAVVEAADANAVVALTGMAGFFGVARVSALVEAVAPAVRGRLVVFFPGSYDTQSYFRLLDARDGWDYRAVPITAGS